MQCPSCKSDRFKSTLMNRNLRNQLEIVDFKCKCCALQIPYKDRKSHSRECQHFVLNECPFKCGKFSQGTFEDLKAHLRSECCAKQLNCQACDHPIYKNFNDVS